MRLALAAFASLMAVATPASACPSCEVGERARALVWSDGFRTKLGVAALPFLVIGAICLRVEKMR